MHRSRRSWVLRFIRVPLRRPGDAGCSAASAAGRSMEEHAWIQFGYPDEPDYREIKTETLLRLVEDYRAEQSCATSALSELSIRKDPLVSQLCRWLLEEKDSDVWLKSSALFHVFDLD